MILNSPAGGSGFRPDSGAERIIPNSPFNVSDWGGERLRGHKRGKCGVPPVGNANLAWVQQEESPR